MLSPGEMPGGCFVRRSGNRFVRYDFVDVVKAALFNIIKVGTMISWENIKSARITTGFPVVMRTLIGRGRRI